MTTRKTPTSTKVFVGALLLFGAIVLWTDATNGPSYGDDTIPNSCTRAAEQNC